MSSLARQLATLRAIPVTPGDWRAAKAKREALTKLEVRMVRRMGRRGQVRERVF